MLFTDESRYCLHNTCRRQRVWRRRGERYVQNCVLQRDRFGGANVMVWAGIHHAGRTNLHFIEGNLTGIRYRDEILRPLVVPCVTRNALTLQQDNARCHTARVCQTYLQQQNVNVLPWPAFSPDLSPIEHLWDVLDRRIRLRNPLPQNRVQLSQALTEEWARIPQRDIQHLISSM